MNVGHSSTTSESVGEAVVLALFEAMARVRLAEMQIVRVYGEQEMRCPVHLHIGQEAISAGVSVGLGSDGRVFGSHRSHGPYLARGGDLTAFFAELYGRAGGACEGRGGSMHLLDRSAGYWGSSAIVGGTIPIAVGSAFAAKYRGEPGVTACFFGDGAVDEGVLYECLNYAAVEELPVLFVCENNRFATNSQQSARQRQTDVAERARAFGVSAESGDGNDAEWVWQATVRAVDLAQRGGGPTLIEGETCRWFGHVGPNRDDGPDGPRRSEEVEAWMARCPLRRFRDRYSHASEGFNRIEAEVAQAVEIAHAEAHGADFPNVERFLAGEWR